MKIRDCKEQDPFISRAERRIIAIVTSCEMVWATARGAPDVEYL